MKEKGKLNFRIHGLECQETKEKTQEVFTDILVDKMLKQYHQLNIIEETQRALA